MISPADLELKDIDYLPDYPAKRDRFGIGVIGAGFIVRDCHLVAYANAGYRVVGITSRTLERAEEVAKLRGIPKVHQSIDSLLDDPEVEVVDVAVPPADQPGVVAQVLARGRRLRGILAQKPLALSFAEAKKLVDDCARAGVTLQVNQNMRYDQSVRALKALLDRGVLGAPFSRRSTCARYRTGCPGPATDGRWLLSS